MKYLDYLETKILLERLVIGLEEPILVKGLGELQAKIDSGNGGYNVIHGTDFHQQGDVLMFTTHDSFGHEHKISAKIIDDIEVNMGGGNIEKRPVIELDIKFAGEDYKKIPFSVSDRSTNTHPILISKGFVENELEALIDVGAKNISKDGVDVVYGEGFLNKVAKSAVTGAKVAKGLAKGGASLTKGAWDATKGVASGAKGLAKGAAGAVGSAAKGATGLVKGAAGAVGSAASGVTGALGKIGSGIANSANWLKGGENVSLLSPVKGAANIGKDLVKGAAGAVSNTAKGAWDATKGVAGAVGNAAKGAWDATKGVASGAKGLVAGTVGAVAALGGAAVVKAISNCAKKLANSEAVGEIDQDNIRKQLTSLNWIEKYAKDENYVTENTLIPNWTQNDFKKHPIIPVVSFTGKKGGITGKFGGVKIKSIKKLINDWDKEIKKAKTAVEELKSTSTTQGQNKTEEQEEELYLHESLLILEADDTNTQETETTKESDFVKNFSRFKNFTLWFIPVSKSAKNEKTNILNKFKEDNNIDATLKNCFYKDVSKNSFNDIITSLQKILNETNMEMDGAYNGFFALCTGDYQNIEEANNRTIDYYDKNLVLLNKEQYKAFKQQKFNDTQDKLFSMGLDTIKSLIDGLEGQNQTVVWDNLFKKHPLLNDNIDNYPTIKKIRLNEKQEGALTDIKNFLDAGSLQIDIINLILDEKNKRKEFNKIKDEDKTSWDNFVKACSNLPMFKNQENKPVEQQQEEQEEDAWVNDKLNYLRSKGII